MTNLSEKQDLPLPVLFCGDIACPLLKMWLYLASILLSQSQTHTKHAVNEPQKSNNFLSLLLFQANILLKCQKREWNYISGGSVLHLQSIAMLYTRLPYNP